jgi:hypothetical protein
MAVQTQIQTRRGTAATWTSTNPTLAAGEIGFESDTGKFKIGNGSTAWASLAYATNGAVVSPLTTKGDLFTYSTTNARLAVGNNGESLVADSSTSTGLRYQAAFNGNAVINGGFDFWQRGTSFTAATVYTADRWQKGGAANYTLTRQTSGLTGFTYCARAQRNNGAAGGSTIDIAQAFETETSLRFAGKTVALSFWARAGANFSSASSALTVRLIGGTGTDQTVFSGYTGSVDQTLSASSVTLTTSWQRFSVTGTVTSNITELTPYFSFATVGTAGANDYFEITGVQLELGSASTSFTRAGGTLQGELAACQRYYWKLIGSGDGDAGNGHYYTSTGAYVLTTFPVVMRTTPTVAIENSANWMVFSAGTGRAVSGFAFSTAEPFNFTGSYTTSAATAGNGCWVEQTNANAALTFSAEL